MAGHHNSAVVAIYDADSPYTWGIAELMGNGNGQLVIASAANRLPTDSGRYRGWKNVRCLRAPRNRPKSEREFFSKIRKKHGAIDALIIDVGHDNFQTRDAPDFIRASLKKLLDAVESILPFARAPFQLITIGPSYLFPIAEAAMRVRLGLEGNRTEGYNGPFQLTMVFSSKDPDEPENMTTTLIEINDRPRSGCKAAPRQSYSSYRKCETSDRQLGLRFGTV